MTQDTSSQDGPKRAVLYARVSTDEQAEGYSLTTQLEACQKYAKDFIIVDSITDDYTGTKLERPGLDKVRAMIDRHEIDAVIVNSSDRLSRKLAHVLVLREKFQRAGIELHFVNRGKSEDTPESRMTENIEGVFNEYWREKIVEASRRGSHGKANAGKVVGGGQPPYGYAFIKEKDGKVTGIEIIESEAAIVRMIYQWYVLGNDENHKPMTGYAIAKKLSEIGLPTPGERFTFQRRTRPSGMWDTVTVRKILTNETYAGTWRYGKRIGQDGHRGRRAIKDTIEVTVPAIVSREIWKAAQDQRDYNVKMSKRNCKRDYLLRGLVECGCGRNFTGVSRHQYSCNRNFRYFRKLEELVCREKAVEADLLEHVVWDLYVMEGMSDPETFRQGLIDTQARMKAEAEPKQSELEATQAQIVKTEAEARNVADEIKTVQKDGLMHRTLKVKETEIDRQYTDLCKHRDSLIDELKKKTITDDEIDNAVLTSQRIIRGLQNPTPEMKRAFFEFIRVHVIIKDGKAKVMGNMPTRVMEFDLRIAPNVQPNNIDWLAIVRTFDLDEVSRAFFAKVGMSVEP